MKFNTIAEAFNHYRTFDNAALEKRAQEIRGTITTDPNVDINAINIELEGIKQAKENNDQNAAQQRSAGGFNVITGANTAPVKKTFDKATVADTPEYRSAFYKTMLGHSLNEDEKNAFSVAMGEMERRADAFNSSSDSAAVLPTETLNEIVRKAHKMGGLMAECRAFNVPTKISIPVGAAGSKAAWHTEGAAVDTEKATVVNVSFDGYEIIKIFSISEKVRKMSVPAFEAYLTDELTACVMETIADSLVNGTGSAQGSGLETITWNASNSVTIGASATAAYADVVNLVAMLPRGYSAGAKFAMNNATLYRVFYGMVDSSKRPIFLADPKAENIGKILGYEVIVDDNIADNDVYFGNFSKYLAYNLPEGIVVDVSRESGFRKGVIDYRALAIADTKPIVPEAFVKMTKASA